MTDNQGGEAATVENTAAAPEAAVLSQERDYDAEAREQGWRPKEEWSGKPENWKDAKTYVERGEEITRYSSKAVKEAEARFDERVKKLEAVNTRTIAALEAQHAEAIDKLKGERREAIKAGDADKVDQIDEKIDKLKEDAPSAPKKLSGEALNKHNEKVQKEWVAKQEWWDTDEDMTEFAIGRSQTIAGKNPDISIEDNIAQVEAALRKKFPEKFGEKKPGANGHAPVDGGGSFPGAGGNKKDPLSNLPAEAKTQAKSDMAKFPKVYPDAEAWLKAYNS